MGKTAKPDVAATLPVFAAIRGQDRALKLVATAVRAGVVPNAYLFVGPAGVGKKTAAVALAQALLCLDEKNPGCGECAACRRVAKESHPDCTVLAAKGQGIKVDQVRELIARFAALRPFEGRCKVAIVDEAEKLHAARAEAANALLKTLEEPPGQTKFILVAESTRLLLPTIVSRCRVVRFAPLTAADLKAIVVTARRPGDDAGLDDDAALEFVAELAGGSAGRALELLADATPAELREQTAGLSAAIEAGGLARLNALGALAADRETWAANLTLLRTSWRSAMLRRAATGGDYSTLLARLDKVREAQRRLRMHVQPRLAADALAVALDTGESHD